MTHFADDVHTAAADQTIINQYYKSEQEFDVLTLQTHFVWYISALSPPAV